VGKTIETNRIEYKSKLTDNLDEIQLKIKDKLKHNIAPSCLGLFEIIVEKKDDKIL
jgi:hypothetical protein